MTQQSFCCCCCCCCWIFRLLKTLQHKSLEQILQPHTRVGYRLRFCQSCPAHKVTLVWLYADWLLCLSLTVPSPHCQLVLTVCGLLQLLTCEVYSDNMSKNWDTKKHQSHDSLAHVSCTTLRALIVLWCHCVTGLLPLSLKSELKCLQNRQQLWDTSVGNKRRAR